MKTVVKICSIYWWEWKTENSNFTPIVKISKYHLQGCLQLCIVVARATAVPNLIVEYQAHNVALNARNVMNLHVRMHQ